MNATLPQEIAVSSKEEIFSLFDYLLFKGGPEPEDYEGLNSAVNLLPFLIENNEISEAELKDILDRSTFLKSPDSIMGHIRQKPFGYAGDFSIIDRIYKREVSKEFVKWDSFSVNHLAAEAVRNRKDYFLDLMTEKMEGVGRLHLLNVASGPARDLFELYDSTFTRKLQATCVEYDKRAIEHAKTVCKNFLRNIQFINQNIFRYDTEAKFDVVWSAGLFDYFDDKTFVRTLQKFIKWTSPGGETIVGNFSDDNPSRAYMEIFGDWHLKHRSAAELQQLAIEAGARPEQISVDTEPLGINLFLRIRRF